METIIQQIANEMVGEIITTALENKLNLERMIPRILELLKGYAAGIVRQLIMMTDQSMVEDKACRRSEGLVIERRADKRSVMTEIGEIQYERAYYLNQGTGTYGYPIDQLIGVIPYQHVDVGLSKALVSKSREESYGRVVRDCCDGKLSRQTVFNKIRLAQAVIEVPLEKRKVPELHFDADEDHVAMQGGKGKKTRAIVPLISVYEGIEQDGKRHRCKNVFHISAYGKSPEELWEEVLTRTEQRYDLSDTKIYLHGDGAGWIAKGIDSLYKSKFVLDKYHKNKYLSQLLGGYDKGKAKQLRKDLNQALNDKDEVYFDNIVQLLLMEMPHRTEKILVAANYLKQHMPAIAIHQEDPSAGNGGATEPHISHVLSSRLSSRPMGWSKGTLVRFAPILANGPEVSIKRNKPSSCLSMTAVKAFKATQGRAKEIRLKEAQPSVFPVVQLGKRTELYRLLHSMELSPSY